MGSKIIKGIHMTWEITKLIKVSKYRLQRGKASLTI